jgi:carbon monoxide dehydrogenase subunit G
MKRIESCVKHIAYSQEQVYAKVSDLSNLKTLIDRIPEDQKQGINLENLECSPDKVSTVVQPVGKVEVAIVSREPFKCVKMESTQSPIKLYLWIQIVSTGQDSCKIKITVDADLNIFIAKMAEKPLTEAVEKLADMLAVLQY